MVIRGAVRLRLCRNSRPATVAVQRRDLVVDEGSGPAARGTDHPILSSRASSAASLPPDAAADHASRLEGIAKTKLRASKGLRHGNRAIASHQSRPKTGLAHWVEGRRGRCPSSTIGLLQRSSSTGYARRNPQPPRDRAHTSVLLLAPLSHLFSVCGAAAHAARRKRGR
jgi:hypothetical protein